MTPQSHLSDPHLLHLGDDELQELADGEAAEASGRPESADHFVFCGECQAAVESYRQLAQHLGTLQRPKPPGDFTDSLLARLPPAPPPMSAGDLAAVVVAAGAAALAAILFLVGDGTSALLGLLREVPGRALAEAALAASLQARNQVSLLLFCSVGALLIGTPLWRVLSPPRAAA